MSESNVLRLLRLMATPNISDSFKKGVLLALEVAEEAISNECVINHRSTLRELREELARMKT